MKTLVELEAGDCRFPFETDDGYRFCAEPQTFYQFAGKICQSPYCLEHKLICIQPLREHAGAA